MKIKVHVQGIKGNGLMKEGDEANALFGGVLEIDGLMIEEIMEIRTRAHEGFFEVTPVLAPGSFEVVTHNKESWPSLLQKLDEQRSLRTMNGQLIARVEEE